MKLKKRKSNQLFFKYKDFGIRTSLLRLYTVFLRSYSNATTEKSLASLVRRLELSDPTAQWGSIDLTGARLEFFEVELL